MLRKPFDMQHQRELFQKLTIVDEPQPKHYQLARYAFLQRPSSTDSLPVRVRGRGLSFVRSHVQIVAFLDAALARRVPGHPAMPGPQAAPGESAPAGGSTVAPGSCDNILQVKDTLAACLGYFRRMEPSSPAVLLIGQAQQLIGKSLVEVIQIMFPEHFGQAVLEIGDRPRFRLPPPFVSREDVGAVPAVVHVHVTVGHLPRRQGHLVQEPPVVRHHDQGAVP